MSLTLAFLDIEDCVSRIPLREDCLCLGEGYDFPTLPDGGEEFLGVEVALFPGRLGWWHQKLSPNSSTTLLNIYADSFPPKDVHFRTQFGFLPLRWERHLHFRFNELHRPLRKYFGPLKDHGGFCPQEYTRDHFIGRATRNTAALPFPRGWINFPIVIAKSWLFDS